MKTLLLLLIFFVNIEYTWGFIPCCTRGFAVQHHCIHLPTTFLCTAIGGTVVNSSTCGADTDQNGVSDVCDAFFCGNNITEAWEECEDQIHTNCENCRLSKGFCCEIDSDNNNTACRANKLRSQCLPALNEHRHLLPSTANCSTDCRILTEDFFCRGEECCAFCCYPYVYGSVGLGSVLLLCCILLLLYSITRLYENNKKEEKEKRYS